MTGPKSEMRIDKWLWAVRIYKTRSQAAEECKKGRILIDNMAVKPSRIIKPGDTIIVRKLPVIYIYKVKNTLNSRISAKLVPDYYENLTPEEEFLKLNPDKIAGMVKRDRGTGRPTKKERRDIDKLKNSSD